MIRIIVKETDCGEAANVPNGQTYITIKSFEYDLPELEKYLKDGKSMKYGGREIVGYEIL